MGRITKYSDLALKAAAEMLESSRNQSLKASVIKTVLGYDLRQRELAVSNKGERRKRAERKEPGKSRSEDQKPPSAANSLDKDWSDLKAELEKEAKLERDLKEAKREAAMALKTVAQLEEYFKVTHQLIKRVAPSAPAEKWSDCAAESFEKLKSTAPELLPHLFESMGFNLEEWYSWDSKYGQNSDLMLGALLCPEKHEPEKLSLLRLKLAAMHRDYIAAINAVRDYRDLRIDLNKLKKLTSPHIIFLDLDSGLRIKNVIPEKFMPRLTEAALRDASATMQNDPSEKLKWLEVVRELLKADSGIDLLLLMEQSATLAQQTSPVEILDDNKRLR